MGREITRVQFPADLSVYDEVIDVRSRLEYREDHISGAVLLPVLDDTERAEIGTIYKQVSAFEARKKGAVLVTKNISSHLETHFAEKPKDYRALVYCWRGGQRSGSLATVLGDIGWDISVIEGGYRSYRRMVLDTFESAAPQFTWIVLNGYTGAGKTLVLKELREQGAQVLDLEGLANHKGSVFGGDPSEPQPAQKRFESLIFDDLSRFDPEKPIFVEAESAKIGRLNLPNPIWQEMKVAPVLEIDSPLDARADYLTRDYEEWVGDLSRVESTLDRLSSFHSREILDQWKELSRRGEWRTLIRDLLDQHYDKRYTVDGSGYFSVPSEAIPLERHDGETIGVCAREVLAAADRLREAVILS